MSVEAVIVNHDTSPFSELCLRSLRATHRDLDGDLAITVVDNHSTDEGLDELVSAANELDATFDRSRFPIATKTVNTHGDVLRDFVLDHPEATSYLFLDADIVFVHQHTIEDMQHELDADDRRWAVQARFFSAERRAPGSSIDMGAGTPQHLYGGIRDPDSGDGYTFPVEGMGRRRCHPGCALVRNSDAFQRTAANVGLGTAIVLSQDQALAGYYDTLALASATMATHGLRYDLSAATVVHYFNVSYDDRIELTAEKRADCRRRLAILRDEPSATTDPGPWG